MSFKSVLIGLLAAAPAVQGGFVSPAVLTPAKPQSLVVSPLAYRQTYDTETKIKEEAETAFRAAQAAAQIAISKKSTPLEIPTLSDLQDMSDLQKEALAATAGGALLGAGLGVAAAMGHAEAVDPVVPAAIMGSAAYVIGRQDDGKGRATRFLLGKPTKALGKFIASKFKQVYSSTVASITSIPDRVAEAFQSQIEKTKAQVVAIPGNVMAFIKLKIDQATLEAQRAPKRMADAAVAAATDLGEEIKATPGRVADNAKQALEKATLETKQMLSLAAVEDAPVQKKEELVPKPPSSEPPLTLFMY